MHLILIAVVVVLALYILFKAAKVMIKIVLFVVILVIAYFTNPDLKDHRHAALDNAKKASIKLNTDSITITDLKICSITKQNDTIIGFGAFTRVWFIGWP